MLQVILLIRPTDWHYIVRSPLAAVQCVCTLHTLHWHLVFPLSSVCFPYKGVCAFKASLDCVCV